jgi:hypothetical protein
MVNFKGLDWEAPNNRNNFSNAYTILPCGLMIKNRFDCCANSCRDKEKIDGYRRDPTSPFNPIERCYNSLASGKKSAKEGERKRQRVKEEGIPLAPHQEDAAKSSETTNPTE